jgi:Family of unknown function (DUF5522)
MPSLIEEEDFYYNEQGYMVLTAHYLLRRGFCCGNGCKHCPYHYEAVPEPRRSELLAQRKPDGEKSK